MAIAIILKSSLNANGYLTPDSIGYLALAQNLIEGKGFHTFFSYLPQKDRVLFAIWPVGYPVLIYLVAKTLCISVFWASKILNILFVGASLLLFRKLFKKNAYIYGLIFYVASFILIFSHTWSEVPFIFGLLWFSASIFYFYKNGSSAIYLFNIFASSLFLFLNRYIGAFAFGFMGLMSLNYLMNKDYKTSLKLIVASLLGFMIIALYLYHNYLQTGYPTGILRLPAPETISELLKSLFRALLIEFNLIRTSGSPYIENKLKFIAWLSFQTGLFLFFYYKIKDNIYDINGKKEKYPLWLILFSIGVTYLICIVSIRFFFYFVDFYCRLLGPASFLFIISLISYFEFRYAREVFNKLKVPFIIVCITSYLLNVPLITIKMLLLNRGNPYKIYSDTVNGLQHLYSKIPRGSVVVFPNIHLAYLRTDIIGLEPLYVGLVHSKTESMDEFIRRIHTLFPENKVFFQIYGNMPNKERFHDSIIEFIDNNKNLEFVRLK